MLAHTADPDGGVRNSMQFHSGKLRFLVGGIGVS